MASEEGQPAMSVPRTAVSMESGDLGVFGAVGHTAELRAPVLNQEKHRPAAYLT